MLQLERVSLSYGSFRALDNITLHAGAGAAGRQRRRQELDLPGDERDPPHQRRQHAL
jgi:hypothetical protein